MRAILSDVHGNLEALRAVLADAARHGAREVYCLGDVVGYGPDPCACLDLVMRRCAVTVLGNHDRAALSDPRGFNDLARRALRWTRGQLEAPGEGRRRRLDFLAGLPRRHREGAVLYVHASPGDPLREYVFPGDACDPWKMGRLFALVGGCCFQGHTHVPGVFTQGRGFDRPEALGGGYRLGGRKAMVNVGSVGQPRDGDPRACYALFDGAAVRFRRVAYEVGVTMEKVCQAGLDSLLGERLALGW
jgi:diadenosine tetraphosphatase ApaH/serine/threonine PP2A family protein phosphatase